MLRRFGNSCIGIGRYLGNNFNRIQSTFLFKFLFLFFLKEIEEILICLEEHVLSNIIDVKARISLSTDVIQQRAF